MCQPVTSGASAKSDRDTCTLADIFRQHGQVFRESHPLSTPQYKAMRAIEICRTSLLGGHQYECDHCGAAIQRYNSCRNRHCPQCQSIAKAKWLSDREAECLPVEYFHVVFTLPHELNQIAQCNHQLIYNLLYESVWHAVRTLGIDPKRLDGEMGMISILHTWGQNLSQHIHLHCVIPGGALKKDQSGWTSAKPKFLFPVKVLSRLFRGHYISRLRDAFKKGELRLNGTLSDDSNHQEFQTLINKCMQHDWVVYSKPPFDGAKSILKYLSRYTHKIAIINQRLISCKEGKVRFWWRDYAHGNKKKIMTLTEEEFIRRFMLHILPAGFVRIRHFGFLSNACRNKKLPIIRKLLGAHVGSFDKNKENSCTNKTEDWMLHLTGIDINQCPHCKQGKVQAIRVIERPTYWDSS